MTADAPVARESTLLARFLAERPTPCPLCAAVLEAAPEARCPRCRARLELGLDSEQAAAGPWLLALLVVAIPGGFQAVALVFGLAARMRGGTPAGFLATIAMLGGAALLSAGGIVLLVRFRRRFHARSRGVQWRNTAIVVVIAAALGVFTFRLVL